MCFLKPKGAKLVKKSEDIPKGYIVAGVSNATAFEEFV